MIYLERTEIQVQRKLREIAGQEREQGAGKRLEFRKIRINGNNERKTMVFFIEKKARSQANRIDKVNIIFQNVAGLTGKDKVFWE